MSPIHIIISGASSVGKSTLVDECLRKFQQDKRLKLKHWKRIQEVARTVLNHLNLTGRDLQNYVSKNDIRKFSTVQEKIIHEQISQFNKEQQHNYLSDRAGFDALAYIHQYFNNEDIPRSIFQGDLFQSLIDVCQSALIFIIQPQEDLKAQNDNMRMVPNYDEQMRYTASLVHWYQEAKLTYFMITDLDLAKRIEFIEKHVRGYFQWTSSSISIPLSLPFHLDKFQYHGHSDASTVSKYNYPLIRSIEISDEQHLRISYKKYDPNRLVEKYDQLCVNDKFITVSFDQRLDSQFVEQLLSNRVLINGQQYNFIGCSNSQLKSRSCYLCAGSPEDVESIINDNGDFHKMKNLSKRAARIGLLFSSCTPTIHIEPDHVIEISDIERNGYTFTDGCGIIGRALTRRIVPYLDDFKKPLFTFNDDNQREINSYPCAFQIRYQGCKGVLMINNDDQDDRIQLRPSMKKFISTISTCLYVCDDGYSKPKLGFLIKQFIMLLSGLNIADEVFLRKQDEHFREILSMCNDMNVAMKYALYFDRIDIVYHLLSNDIESTRSELKILQRKAIEAVEKLKIPITKSRLALGVCDPYGILRPGEVYFQPTFNGRQFMIDSKICFVAKSPSYHLGDIQVFKLTSYQQLEHLYDVIVFPTQGSRPHPNEIAGSDLDGDKYLICWDNDLIPQKTNKPMNYNSTAKAQESELITRKDLINHFASAYKNNQSGIVDKYYNYWANLLGVKSIQCRRLAELFSEAVDAPKTGHRVRIPNELKPPHIGQGIENSQSTGSNNGQQSEFVWIKLLNRAKKFKDDFRHQSINENELVLLSKETLLNLFYERRCPNDYNFNNVQSLSEYSLVITTLRWCAEQEDSNESLNDFICLFDLSQLTIEEKQNIDLSLKIDQSNLYSVLNQSKLLSKELINTYHLSDTGFAWRLFYTSPKFFGISSPCEHEQTFKPITYVLKQNSIHERTLINISINNTITLVLDIYKDALVEQPPSAPNSDTSKITYQILPGLCSAYLESKLYSVRRKFLFDVDYFLKMTPDRIQIYQTNERNSFIVFMYDDQHESKIISVDLTRFDRNILRTRNHPKVNRHSFLYFEIFVFAHDQQTHSIYYPVISYYDEEYFTQNYFNERIENYEFVEYLTEKEKEEEEIYKNEMKQYQEKRAKLILIYENMSEENVGDLINEFMSIHDSEYLQKIWMSLSERKSDLNENLLNYFYKEMKSMLYGSIHRPFIDENWFYHLITSSAHQEKHVNEIYQLIKRFNTKLKDKSHLIYMPFLPRIVQRFLQENDHLIQEWNLINSEFIYHVFLAFILGNNYNTDELSLNYLIEADFLKVKLMTLEQTMNLIRACLMTKDSDTCERFLQQLSTLKIIENDEYAIPKSMIDYVIQFISIIVRTTVYDLDDISRRIKFSRETLVRNGETIFDLRARLVTKNSNDSSTKENEEDEENKCQAPIFHFEHYQHEKIPSHHLNIGDSIALIDQEQSDKEVNRKTQINENIPLRLFYQAFGVVVSVYPILSVKFTYWPVSLTNNNYLNQQKLFRLERLPNFVTLNRSIDALEKIIDYGEHLIIKPFLNLSEDVDKERLGTYAQEQIHTLNETFDEDYEYNNAFLNSSQRQAIRYALENRLTLIQGPPGTGKTETSAWIIRMWLKHFFQEGHPLLVCAETHQAVDNLARRLLQYRQYRLIRYGEPRTVASDLQQYTMATQIELLRRSRLEVNPDSTRKRSVFGPAKPSEIREIVSKCQILCMTCSGVGILESSLKFPFILIDEASQITEPNILISLVRITDQIVLVGDQKQLPPIIKMAAAKLLLERSFFQRLLENLNIYSIMLDTQYRMHPSLIEFPSKVFYNNSLKTGIQPEQRPIPEEINFTNKQTPLMFVNVEDGYETIHGSNIFNKKEVELVCQTIQKLLPSRRPTLSPTDIGIITPYTRQVKEIVEKLSSVQVPKGVEIRTVDGFQGREKDIILISLVRSNDDSEIGFLINEQRMNVLLTRAKRAMIVFGNKRTLISCSLWKQWIESVPNITSIRYVNECLRTQTSTICHDQLQTINGARGRTSTNKKPNRSGRTQPR